jgi:hypothetical protein
VDLNTDIIYENLVLDRAGKILRFECEGVRGLLLFNLLEPKGDHLDSGAKFIERATQLLR